MWHTLWARTYEYTARYHIPDGKIGRKYETVLKDKESKDAIWPNNVTEGRKQ